MLDKLLTNKKVLAVMVVLIVIIVGISIAVMIGNDTKENGESGIRVDTEKDKEDSQENVDENDKPYNGTGLEIMDEVDGTVDSVDGSGDWNETSDDQREQDNKADNTQSDDAIQDESNDEENIENENSDKNILVDDKVWGEPS